jgi:hypothetical protein
MPNLIPSKNSLDTNASDRLWAARPDRRTAWVLVTVERKTQTRVARIRGHAIVQTEKLHEIDHLTREAMTGQALLSRWAATLAQDDPFLADDLKFFADVARLGKGEVIADTISDFCQEGRQ